MGKFDEEPKNMTVGVNIQNLVKVIKLVALSRLSMKQLCDYETAQFVNKSVSIAGFKINTLPKKDYNNLLRENF